jgi:hypothetical protein
LFTDTEEAEVVDPADKMAQKQTYLDELTRLMFEAGDEETKLGMALMGNAFQIFAVLPTELVPEGYLRAFELTYGPQPPAVRALLSSLMAFVGSAYETEEHSKTLIDAMVRSYASVPAMHSFLEQYEAEHGRLVSTKEVVDLFEELVKETNADVVAELEDLGAEIHVHFPLDGTVEMHAIMPDDFDPSEPPEIPGFVLAGTALLDGETFEVLSGDDPDFDVVEDETWAEGLTPDQLAEGQVPFEDAELVDDSEPVNGEEHGDVL